MEFSRPEYWSGFPFPSLGDLHNPGIEPRPPTLQADSLAAEQQGEVSQSCPTLCDPMDCSLPGFSVHGIFQERILEWVAISFSRGSPNPGIGSASLVYPALAGKFFTTVPLGLKQKQHKNRYFKLYRKTNLCPSLIFFTLCKIGYC